MRVILLLVFGFCSYINSSAQKDPISWTFSVERTGNDTYQIILEGTIQPGWYIYSQFLEEDDGPVPTTVYIVPQNDAFDLVGIVKEEGHKKEGFDPIFEMQLIKYYEEIKFVQEIKMRGEGTQQLEGHIEYMTCNDNSCLPPKEVPFSLTLDRS